MLQLLFFGDVLLVHCGLLVQVSSRPAIIEPDNGCNSFDKRMEVGEDRYERHILSTLRVLLEPSVCLDQLCQENQYDEKRKPKPVARGAVVEFGLREAPD